MNPYCWIVRLLFHPGATEVHAAARFRAAFLPVAALVCLAVAACPAGDCLGQVAGSEAGVRASATADAGPELSYLLSFLAGRRLFTGDDMDATYGGVTTVGMRAGIETDHGDQIWFGAMFGADKGNPYYDLPDFTSGPDSKLKIVPLQTGARAILLRHAKVRSYLGLSVELAWIEEETPGGEDPEVNSSRFKGWTFGWHLSLAHEYRYAAGSRGFGAEIMLGGSGGEQVGARNHDIDLSGFAIQVYYSFYP